MSHDLHHTEWDWSSPLAALRSIQIFLGSVTTVAPTTVYTVPAGKRTIIKFISVQNTTAGNRNVQFRLSTLGTVLNWTLTAYGSGNDKATATVWIVLNPGDTIALNPTVAGQIDVTISGSLHTI